MFLTRSEYDRDYLTGIEERLGSTAIGIQTSEGVCLAVEKRITSPLMEPSSIEKIVEIDAHIGCAMSGLIADAKTLIDKARVETQSMTLKEAIKSSLIILKQVMEEKLNATNIELATVQPGQNFHMFTKEELEEVIKDI
ncbi:hypothetical protein GH733_015052 [Mirounga leonina]|nr:hypothetical protein GH733_015052 [Mirounga leonina]